MRAFMDILDSYAHFPTGFEIFILQEYRKRHFEYYHTQEAHWLKKHWNDGLCDIFEDELSSILFFSYYTRNIKIDMINEKNWNF